MQKGNVHFLWILCAMGVAYWAKLEGRQPFWWFTIAVLLSPLVGSIAYGRLTVMARASP